MRASETESVVQSKAIALVGAPNSGKTTLYNWLTGSRFKTVNYPGATVEFSLGKLASHLNPQNHDVQVMDTPGTYSLHPKSADEWVTLRSLYENPKLDQVDGVILVVDGTQISRHLQLVMQLRETGFPMIVVITMADLLRKEGIEIDMEYLRKTLGCPVLQFDGLLAGGLKEIVTEAEKLSLTKTPSRPVPWSFEIQETKLKQCEQIAQTALTHKTDHAQERLNRIVATTEKLDRVLLHPVFGFFFFVLIMGGLFSCVYWLATPFMDLIDGWFTSFADQVVSWAPGALWTDFLANGIVTSFAAFLVFVPQIFILFIGIGILESTGYLARAATLIDRPFSALGMSGRSFVPLLSGFACAVPAIIATRNIPSTKDRLITAFVIPLMSCSARLPVYALFIAFLFHGDAAWKAGLALAALYIGSMFIGALAAGVVSKFIPKSEPSLFMMELPIYRRPKLRVLLRQSLTRTLSYVKRAGPVIFVFAVVIWAGSTFPHYQLEDAHQKLEESYVGQLGKVIEPVVAPMGVDWRVGVGLISAFAAREVFVSSLALTFNITDTDEDTQQAALLTQMGTAVNSSGEKIFTVSSVIGLMLFFLIALQCMSTVGVQIRESGSWKFAVTQLVVFNLFAYVLVVALVQGLRWVGVS
ncbi:ferrous iron transporter B [Bdellovibrio sp. 22V]|uniref:ferrous iron transporter B n=1 Tax=Bdellovibrio sp. 22V TaxID=3044166 RepID=UPI0025428A9F|nr:ferrous iron transporter B [Bdellovibrio sp. 22V]WII70927.1 ferrous iron transporter B [Bdellovibrio sp. 22V]